MNDRSEPPSFDLHQPESSTPSAVLTWMVRAFLVWLFVYMSAQGQDGFFAVTVDRVEAAWIKWVFLNLPLQILLTLVVAISSSASGAGARKLGLAVGALNCVLILGHVALSVATA